MAKKIEDSCLKKSETCQFRTMAGMAKQISKKRKVRQQRTVRDAILLSGMWCLPFVACARVLQVVTAAVHPSTVHCCVAVVKWCGSAAVGTTPVV